jgi:hypothetical protein
MHSPATAEAIEARRTDAALTRGSPDYTGAAVVAWRCAVRGITEENDAVRSLQFRLLDLWTVLWTTPLNLC